MVMPGETIATGAPTTCEDCGKKSELTVCKSSAYYIGAWCDCGPYCRESGYYATREEAEHALKTGDYSR